MKARHAVKATLLMASITFTLACGYNAKTAPPVAGTIPAINQLSPDSVNAGDPGFTLTINGTNFSSKATVNWNGTAQTATTFVSGNQLVLAVPASAIAASGTAMVSVTNPGTPGTGIYGTGATLPETSAVVNFTIN